MGGYAAKRMRFADGVDYPVAPPPMYGSHLQVPDVYSALAKTGFMPGTMAHLGAAYGPTNPFLPAMLNGGGLHPNHGKFMNFLFYAFKLKLDLVSKLS